MLCHVGRVLRLIAALALSAAAAACSRPVSYEKFITVASSEGGLYEFDLDLSDTLATYDIWFYTRTQGHEPDTLCLPILVAWQAPDSTIFEEQVFMRPCDSRGAKELYRSGVAMDTPGNWKLSLRPVEVPMGFCGMGVICYRNDGTR